MNGSAQTIAWIAVGIACGWALWAGLVFFLYRVRAAPPRAVLRARCSDGWKIALHFRPAEKRRFEEPVLLCHGLAANRYTFDFEPPYSLAHSLSAAGFDCYSVEWRGTGASGWAPLGRRWWDYSIDDHIRLDAPAAVERVLEASGAKKVFWVGHSLGGLIGYAAAEGPVGAALAGLVALGSPVFFPADPLVRTAVKLGAVAAWPFGLRQRMVSLTLAPFLGRITLPLSDVVINPQHMPPAIQRKVYAKMVSAMGHRVLSQFRDWIEHDAFRSRDRSLDYRAALPKLKVPLLVLGGSSDRLARREAVEGQYALAGSEDKTLVIFGKDNGDAYDYGHGDLLFGTGVAREVHPLMLRWLSERATAISAAG
jgi:pimeloyl-ACP methyl ester carboxylesterase